MERFRQDGHLTDEGLRALCGGKPDELALLETAEHLGFCGACMARYLDIMDAAKLFAPAQPLAKPVLRRIRQKGLRRAFARYGTVAAAACLAVVLWGVGSFALAGRTAGVSPPAGQSAADGAAEKTQSAQMPFNIAAVGQRLGGLMGGLLDGGAPRPASADSRAAGQVAAAPPATARPVPPQAPAPPAALRQSGPTRRQREAVFDQNQTA